MKKRSTLLLLILPTIIFLNSCKKNSSPNHQLQNVIGHVQKGPFINGTSITVFDLQSDLSATGKSFNAQIIDNKGTFELNNISLGSQYASLRADGFYFNEITGQQSASQITLYAVTDITGKSNININILTTLEKPRVEYLVKNGKPFGEAKIQAQKEILSIFNINKSDTKSSENLDISESGEDNAILLAISLIIQGYRTESEMSELISNISTDIREDGILNSAVLGSSLISHAISIDVNSVKNNLNKRYLDMGSVSNVPDFGKYISNFINKTNFSANQSVISYPEKGIHGDNILSLSKKNYISGSTPSKSYPFSFAALAPKGATLIVKVSAMSIVTARGAWSYGVSYVQNWNISEYNTNNHTQVFTINESGKASEIMVFFLKGTYKVEYFEMNSTVPIREKIISVDM